MIGSALWFSINVLLLGMTGHRPPVAADVVIEDVTVVDVAADSTRAHQWIGISGSRIVAISAAGTVRAAPHARHVDGRGRFLIPGLWDMHTHSLWSAAAMRTFLPAYVAYGVTGVRDMGGELPILLAVRDSIRGGSALVPRVYGSGVILDGPMPVDPSISLAVPDSARAVAVADSLAAAGVDFFKVYTLLPRDAYYAVIAEGRRLGKPVAGHVPYGVSPAEAARAGQRSIEHLNDELSPYCTPATRVACEPLLALFREKRTWQVPTLVVLRMKAYAGDSGNVTDPRLAYVPAALRADWFALRRQKMAKGAAYFAEKQERYRGEVWLAGEIYRAGIPMLAGSDAGVAFSYPGSSLHEELELLVTAGLTNADALRSATLWPAEFLAATDSMGTIAPGKVADLVLLRANPLQDVRRTREIETVVLRGRVLDRAALDSVLARVAVAAR